jgi:hypothetical protein
MYLCWHNSILGYIPQSVLLGSCFALFGFNMTQFLGHKLQIQFLSRKSITQLISKNCSIFKRHVCSFTSHEINALTSTYVGRSHRVLNDLQRIGRHCSCTLKMSTAMSTETSEHSKHSTWLTAGSKSGKWNAVQGSNRSEGKRPAGLHGQLRQQERPFRDENTCSFWHPSRKDLSCTFPFSALVRSTAPPPLYPFRLHRQPLGQAK